MTLKGWQARLAIGFLLGWQCFLLAFFPVPEWTAEHLAIRGVQLWVAFLVLEGLILLSKLFTWLAINKRRYRLRIYWEKR